MHGASHVPAPCLTSTSSCRGTLVQFPREDFYENHPAKFFLQAPCACILCGTRVPLHPKFWTELEFPHRILNRSRTVCIILGFVPVLIGELHFRVIQHHCSQTFCTYLGGWEGRSPVRRMCGAQPCEFFLDDFLSIFGTNSGLERRNSGKYAIFRILATA
jgi:hypothetical protein